MFNTLSNPIIHIMFLDIVHTQTNVKFKTDGWTFSQIWNLGSHAQALVNHNTISTARCVPTHMKVRRRVTCDHRLAGRKVFVMQQQVHFLILSSHRLARQQKWNLIGGNRCCNTGCQPNYVNFVNQDSLSICLKRVPFAEDPVAPTPCFLCSYKHSELPNFVPALSFIPLCWLYRWHSL